MCQYIYIYIYIYTYIKMPSESAKWWLRTAIFTALWPERLTVLGLGCSIYGEPAMLGEGPDRVVGQVVAH